MGQKNTKSKISSTSQQSANVIDESDKKLELSFEHNKMEIENKENIRMAIDDDAKPFYRIASNISEKSDVLSSFITDDEKESVISDIELKETTNQLTDRTSILIKDRTNENLGEESETYVENRKITKKVKKVIFADQVLFIRGDERIQIPLTRIKSANETSIRISGFTKLLTDKIDEKNASKSKSKKFKFNNQSSRKNSLSNQSQENNIDTNQLRTWGLIKENTFYGLEKETAIET
jgi:hypothetical protein